jgi:hypothetical protein
MTAEFADGADKEALDRHRPAIKSSAKSAPSAVYLCGGLSLVNRPPNPPAGELALL